jgi:hypothetical protein
MNPIRTEQTRARLLRACVSGDRRILESTRTDGSRFRNTEVLTFDADKIAQAEVYFGWDLP